MKKQFRFLTLISAVLCAGCAHVPKQTVLGKSVRLGEIKGDADCQLALKETLAEHFVLQSGEGTGLHIDAEVTSSGLDETVYSSANTLDPPFQRRVQKLRMSLQLIDDLAGKTVATGDYDLTERGPVQPHYAVRQTEDLTRILVQRAVGLFVKENNL